MRGYQSNPSHRDDTADTAASGVLAQMAIKIQVVHFLSTKIDAVLYEERYKKGMGPGQFVNQSLFS